MAAIRICSGGIACCKARLAAPITDTQVRLALGFLREMEPDMQEINAFQLRYNAFFSRKRVSTGCIDTLHYLVNKDEMNEAGKGGEPRLTARWRDSSLAK